MATIGTLQAEVHSAIHKEEDAPIKVEQSPVPQLPTME